MHSSITYQHHCHQHQPPPHTQLTHQEPAWMTRGAVIISLTVPTSPTAFAPPMRTVIRPNISHRHVSSAQAEIITVATVVATNSFCSSQPGAMLLLIPISIPIPTTLYSHTAPCADEFGNQSVAMVVLICSHSRCLSLSQHESLFLEQTLCGVRYYMLTPVKTREL